MFNFILRWFSFGMFTFLRIAVAVTNNSYSMAMDIFFIMADIFRTNALPDPGSSSNSNRSTTIRRITFTNHLRPRSSLSHTSTQTEECIVLASNEREKSTNTDIFIYNLDSSKKLTITHKNIGSSSMKSVDQCPSSKTNEKLFRIQSIEYDPSTLSLTENVCSDSSPFSSCDMSIENDVSDGQILQFSRIIKEVDCHGQSSKSTKQNQSHNCENISDTTDESGDLEVDSSKRETLESRHEDSITCAQKTSSPIKQSTRLSLTDPCNQLENTFLKRKTETEVLSSETSAESLVSDADENRTSFFENTILLNDSARRRLSLPSSFNTSNAASHFEEIKKLVETFKNTSRHEKSMREIKYPLLNETILDKDEEAKDFFSCSSYESLPVSEHLHNTFFSLYKEDSLTPDFSSVDDFVEAVNKLKSTLSLTNLIKKKMSVPFSFCAESKGEVRLMRTRSCEIVETQKSQEKDSDALRIVNNETILKNVSKEQDFLSGNCIIGDVLASSEEKLNSSNNSDDLKIDECVSSSDHEIDNESSENYLKTCSQENLSEISQVLKSMFDKVISDIDDNELKMSEKCYTNDDRAKPESESNKDNFIETGEPYSLQSSLEPLQLQQEQTSDIFGMQPFQSQNDIDKIMEVDSLDNNLTESSQEESSDNTKNYTEISYTNENRAKPEIESNKDNFIETEEPYSLQSSLVEPVQLQQEQTIDIFGMQPFQSQNDIDKIMEVDSLESNLTESSQEESSDDIKNYSEISSPVTIYEKQTITESQSSETVQTESELENTEHMICLDSDEASKFLPPKVALDEKVQVYENGETHDESFTLVIETDNESKIADESSRQIGERDCISTTMKIDNLECDAEERVISTTCCRNDSLGNDFLSFAEDNSFYDSTLEDSTWTLKELTCK